jgi:hypothetical protein
MILVSFKIVYQVKGRGSKVFDIFNYQNITDEFHAVPYNYD